MQQQRLVAKSGSSATKTLFPVSSHFSHFLFTSPVVSNPPPHTPSSPPLLNPPPHTHLSDLTFSSVCMITLNHTFGWSSFLLDLYNQAYWLLTTHKGQHVEIMELYFCCFFLFINMSRKEITFHLFRLLVQILCTFWHLSLYIIAKHFSPSGTTFESVDLWLQKCCEWHYYDLLRKDKARQFSQCQSVCYKPVDKFELINVN